MLLFLGILKWVLLAIAIISAGIFIFLLSIDDITVEKLFFDDNCIGFILTPIFIGSLIGFLFLTFSVIPKHRAKYYSDEALLERAAAQDMAPALAIISSTLSLSARLVANPAIMVSPQPTVFTTVIFGTLALNTPSSQTITEPSPPRDTAT